MEISYVVNSASIENIKTEVLRGIDFQVVREFQIKLNLSWKGTFLEIESGLISRLKTFF